MMKSTQAKNSVKRGLAAVAVAFALIAGSAVAQEPIKIGSFLSVTGGAAFLGDPEQKTLQLYVDKINAAGGVLGRKLQLVAYDSAGDSEQARTFAKRLIEQDKVDMIVGGSTTGETMAVVPLVAAARIPFISLAGGGVIVEPVKKWVFMTPQPGRLACEKIFTDMQSRKLSKIALISGNGGFDKSMHAECLELNKKYGIDVVADETYGAGDTDMTAQLTKIKNTARVQAVLNAGFGQAPVIVTRNYRQLGITVPLYESQGVASKEFIRLAGAASEGVRLPAGGLLVADSLPASDPQRSVLVSYKHEYESHFKSDVSAFGGHAYDGLMIAVDAIKKAGTTDKAKVRDAIEATHGFIGIGGIFNMSPTDHSGLNLRAFRMVEIKGEDWTLVK
jgi:branched-chain amino acid transport system substrate-binding protein